MQTLRDALSHGLSAPGRRPKEKCPKREGKCVNPGFDTRSAFQIARIGAACSRLRSKSVNRPGMPTPAKQIFQWWRG